MEEIDEGEDDADIDIDIDVDADDDDDVVKNDRIALEIVAEGPVPTEVVVYFCGRSPLAWRSDHGERDGEVGVVVLGP